MNLQDLPAYLAQFKDQYIREAKERCILAAAFATKAEMIQRIFVKGQAADGTRIGTYSVRPMYFPKKAFVRTGAFVKRGTDGKGNFVYGNFKNGKTRKTMFFKSGYGDLRAEQGRESNFKNYKYSGSLEKSINVVKTEAGETVIAITDAKESQKRHGLEAQDDKVVFSSGPSDLAVFKQALSDEIDHLMPTL